METEAQHLSSFASKRVLADHRHTASFECSLQFGATLIRREMTWVTSTLIMQSTGLRTALAGVLFINVIWKGFGL